MRPLEEKRRLSHPAICARFDDVGRDGAGAHLGIMGGTFDPPHFGHLACAEMAAEACGMDGVAFMVAGDPSFKQGQELASAADRLAMCRLATFDNPLFDVSALEAERSGITYTVDTARVLRAHYPACVRLSFIVGADALMTLPDWKDAPDLASLVDIVCVSRPGYLPDAELLAQLERIGFAVELVTSPLLDISSSMIRQRVREGRTVRYLVPLSVDEYLISTGLYRAKGGTAHD